MQKKIDFEKIVKDEQYYTELLQEEVSLYEQELSDLNISNTQPLNIVLLKKKVFHLEAEIKAKGEYIKQLQDYLENEKHL